MSTPHRSLRSWLRRGLRAVLAPFQPPDVNRPREEEYREDPRRRAPRRRPQPLEKRMLRAEATLERQRQDLVGDSPEPGSEPTRWRGGARLAVAASALLVVGGLVLAGQRTRTPETRPAASAAPPEVAALVPQIEAPPVETATPVPEIEAPPAEATTPELGVAAAPPEPPPEPVTLQINGRPWARIHLDDRDLGVTPLSVAGIEPGPYRIEAFLPDGQRLVRRVEIGPDSRFVSFP